MNLNMTNIPQYATGREVEVGNLYLNQKGDYWLVVSVGPVSGDVHVLRYNRDGWVTGAMRYGTHYLRDKPLVGHVEMPLLNVIWEDFPK